MSVATSSELDVSVEAPGGLERRMTVRLPTAQIENEVNSRLAKVGKTAKLKGFRPGKVPAKVVRQRYGAQVRQEVLSDIIRSSYSKAIAQEELQPAGGPRIEPLSGEGEESFSYRATFEVYPDIALKPLEACKIEKPRVELSEADVDQMIEKLRDQRADWQKVERKSAAGDRVIADLEGTIDGEPFEGGDAKEVPILIGSGQVIDDLDKALKGVTAGQIKSAKVKFPKDYPAADVAGKKTRYSITVRRVEEKVLPEIDDAFLAALGVDEGGLEALRSDVRSNMERELAERLKADIKRRALDGLLDANSIQVPNALVEEEINALQAESMRQMGITEPEMAPPRENFRMAAQRRVSLGLLLKELIREHGIELDRPRVDERLKELAEAFEKPDEVARVYRSNRELMAQLESGVLEDQVVDMVLEKAKTTERATSFAEFMGS